MQVMMLLQSWSANPLIKIGFLMIVPMLLVLINFIKTYFEKIHIPWVSSPKYFGIVLESKEYGHNEDSMYWNTAIFCWVKHYQDQVKNGNLTIHQIHSPGSMISQTNTSLFSPLDDQEFQIESPYIFGKMVKVSNQKNIQEHYLNTKTMSSEKTDIKHQLILTVFVKDIKFKHKIIEMSEKFENEIRIERSKMANLPKIYEMKTPTMKEFDSHCPRFIEMAFQTTKSMDKIWFEQKDEFVAKYQHFIHGKEKYMKRGDPWKFSVILHGTPGCGKTSLIKAIANDSFDLCNSEAKPNLIIVPVKSITSAEMLKNIFFSPFIASKSSMSESLTRTEHSSRIYVFDDFDHDLFISRQECLEQPISTNTVENISYGNESSSSFKASLAKEECSFESKKENFLFDMQKKITLEDFLNVLDGIVELNGVRIFWCTNVNEPEKVFDKAFLRPGRQDMIIKLGKLNHEGIQFFIEQFFNEKIEIEKLQHLKINHWSPAEFKSICISFTEKYKNHNCQTQIEKMLETLSLE